VCQDSYDDAPYFASEPPPWQRHYVAELEGCTAGSFRIGTLNSGPVPDQLGAMGALDDTLRDVVHRSRPAVLRAGGLPELRRARHGIFMGAEENRSTAAFWAQNLHPERGGPTMHQDLAEDALRAVRVAPSTVDRR